MNVQLLSCALSWIVASATVFMPSALAEQSTATDSPTSVESRDEALWTGPLLASSASTLPQGHWLFEPYLYNSVAVGRFDGRGDRSSERHSATVGSLAYLIYGATERVSVGVIPKFAYRNASGPGGSSGFGMGDFSVQAQYRLTQFSEEHRVPTTSVIVIETLPTGKYDRLDENSQSALGSGAYITTLAFYSQYYFWLPTGRILRTRLNVGFAWPGSASVADSSVYGTSAGFSGHARVGRTATMDAACEYSVSRNWVLALDIVGEHDDNTRVTGKGVGPSFAGGYASSLGSSAQLVIAPAIEFNWNAHVGVIAGTRIAGLGRNATQTLAGVVALNMVF